MQDPNRDDARRFNARIGDNLADITDSVALPQSGVSQARQRKGQDLGRSRRRGGHEGEGARNSALRHADRHGRKVCA